MQSQTDPGTDPALFSRSYESDDPVGRLRAQSERLLPAVLACLRRARDEGTSLVVEGTHLLPDLYHDEGASFIVLEAPGPREHRRRLLGPRHTRRSMSTEDVLRVRRIGEFYAAEAARLGVPTVRYADNFDAIAALMMPGSDGSMVDSAPR